MRRLKDRNRGHVRICLGRCCTLWEAGACVKGTWVQGEQPDKSKLNSCVGVEFHPLTPN
jgi:hypothetical protein